MTGGPLRAGTPAAPPSPRRPISRFMAMKLWHGRLPVILATLVGVGPELVVLGLLLVVLTVPIRLPIGTEETNRLLESLAWPFLELLHIMEDMVLLARWILIISVLASIPMLVVL